MKRAMTIYYNEDSGEIGKIIESDLFTVEDSLLRADVFKDILYEIQDLYNKSCKAWTNELENINELND